MLTPADRTQQRAALIAATMASFLTPFLGSSIVVALPAIGAELGLTAVQLSWVAAAFMLGSAVCLVPFGRIADLVGRKRVFVTGTVCFTLTTLACGLAHSTVFLITARALQGMSAAMIFGTGLAILTSAFPANQRGRVIGFNASAVYIGLSLGPFVGGLLTRHFGWQSIFFATVPLGVASAIVAGRGLRTEVVERTTKPFDYVGVAIYATMLVALMAGVSALPRPAGLGLLGAALAAAVIFVLWERRMEQPMLDVRFLVGNPVFAWSNVSAFINYSATSTVAFLISLYLQYLRGFDPAQAGCVLLVQSVTMAGVSPFAGKLSDKIEPRIMASAGMGFTVAGLIILCFLHADTPLAVVITTLVVLGIGFGLFSSPNTNAVMSSVPKERLGVASATLGTMRLLGQTVSMGLTVAVLAVSVGRAAITPAVHPQFLEAMRGVFIASAVLCTIGVFASLARGNVRKPEA
ncbi:MFS transporter [Opitutus sp. ER46]|uniref:MFS transporter n=1 Tax=Opitutus sp. ER46 TaxID=2161864 RepID=UPI000D323718|nr:MFS transporter [Opitutus sp. ER46]PTX97895.1 MFS transporter [Opitutus sp. ER46]